MLDIIIILVFAAIVAIKSVHLYDYLFMKFILKQERAEDGADLEK